MGVTLIMGVMVFFVGLTMEILALFALLKAAPVADVGLAERVVLFIGGLVLMLIGYFMARNFPPAASGYASPIYEEQPAALPGQVNPQDAALPTDQA